jgi:hypothetical protein
MAKKKVLAKKGKVKSTQSQKKSSQKQSQSVSVNVNLVKSKRSQNKQPTQRIQPQLPAQFPFNFPPFNPYNFLSNPTNYTPPPKKDYAVYPENDTAPLAGILSTVPVKLEIEGRDEPAPIKISENLPLEKVGEEVILPLEKPEEEIIEPEENPLLTPAEEESYKNLTAQYRSVDVFGLPPPVIGSAEVLALPNFSDISLASSASPFVPEEPPSPAFSEITLASTASPFPSEIRPPSTLPPLNLQPRQQLFGAEEILNPQPLNVPAEEFVFTEGQTGRSVYSAPLRQTTLSDFGIGSAPSVAEEKVTEERKRGRPKGSKSKPKSVEQNQPQFAQPVTEIFAQPVQTDTGLLGLPISEQPNITFLGGTQKTFTSEPEPPPPVVSGGLERQRRSTALPPKEEEFLASPFAFTQRSQSTL